MTERSYAFGVDVGGTTVKLGLFDAVREVLEESWEIPTRTQDGGSRILPDIAGAVKGKMEERGIKAGEVRGVGIGVPGPVLENGVVNIAVNLHWGVVDVKRDLSALLGGLSVAVANDANVAALGEQWKGGGRGYQNIIMITLGTGVGGGIILDGHILYGSHGAAGELGHIKVSDTETDRCNCGKYGCLEQYTSANGIVRVARKALAQNRPKTALKGSAELTSKAIFDEAGKGDEFALSIVDGFGKTLGEAMAVMATILDPEVIVIGGGMSRAGDILMEAVSRYYTQAAFHACRNVVFELAQLGNNAGMYGAVRLILQ